MVLLLFNSRSKVVLSLLNLQGLVNLFALPFSYFFFLPFLFIPCFLSGQISDFQIAEVSVGYPIVQEQLPENYSYDPLFFTTRFPVFNNKKRRITFYIEPQLAITTPPEAFKKAFEFGVNLGLQYPFWKSDKKRFAAAIGAGPHFLSLETELQHRGFLFSDNIELAYYQLLNEQIGFHIKTRFRHLSNANLQKPNLGIDNFFLMVGVFWKAKKFK